MILRSTLRQALDGFPSEVNQMSRLGLVFALILCALTVTNSKVLTSRLKRRELVCGHTAYYVFALLVTPSKPQRPVAQQPQSFEFRVLLICRS